jgi:hypothetical protein
VFISGSKTVIGNNTVSGSMSISGSLDVNGPITATTLIVQTITASTEYSSGSNIFGNSLANTQVFTGSVSITGSALNVNNGGLFVSSSGKVGIGTTSPNLALTVQADSTDMIAWRSPSYEVGRLGLDTNNAHGGIFLYSSGSLAIQISAKPGAYTYFNAGNVGIGTTSPSFASGGGLAIYNATRSNLSLTDNTNTLSIFQQGVNSYLNNISTGDMIFRLGTGSDERMRITSAGNVGIGTTSPYQNLTVLKNQNADTAAGIYNQTDGTASSTTLRLDNGSYNGQLNLYANSFTTSGTAVANTLRLYTDGPGGITFSATNQHIRFNTSPSEVQRMIILYGGNVGIGTGNPSTNLHILANASVNTATIRLSGYGGAATDTWDANAGTDAKYYVKNVSTSNGAYLVYNSASGWTSVSDARWKTDWTDLGPSLGLINQLKIGRYKMLDTNKQPIENARWDYGVKAQELLEVIPDAVDVPDNPEDKHGVINNIVFYHAIKALQEANAKITALEEKLERNNIN